MKKTLFLSAILGAALCSSAYGARTLADYSTTDGEMTFSGAIIEYTGTSNNQAIGTSGVTFNINKSGTTYQKKGASQNPDFGGTNGNLWEYLTTHKDNVVYGHTIKMSGSTGSAVKLNTGGMGATIFGGLITTSANNNASYTLDASSGDVILKGNDSGANMNIGSNTTLSTSTNNTVEVQGDGTWNIQGGKSLTLAGGRFWINGANTVTLSGGGTLKFNIGNTNKLQLDANSGFNITGGTTVEMNDGLKCEFGTGAGFTSTDGTGKINYAVTAKQTAGATNGFGTLTYATPGNLSIGSGVTLLLNGVEADYTDGTLSTASTIYHIVENTAFNVASMSSYTGATGFQIESGATLRITEKTTNNNGIIYGAVTVKNGGVLQLEANDALGWSGNNVKSLLVENGAEVKLTHSSNETWGGVLTLQGNAKISGDNARWDMYYNSSATVAASANATLDIKELCLRRDDVTFTLGNNATLTINSALTKGSESQNGKLIITANHGSGAIVNLNGEANGGVIGLQFAGVTANINEDMTVTQLMLSKNDALTTVNVAAGKTLTITGTTMPVQGGSFELANWARSNVLNIEGTVIANSGITTEGSNATPTINIKNGGTLTMNAGLSAVSRLGGNTQTTINVESGATLNVGGTEALADSTLITVNVKDGAILGGAYGSGTTAIINKNFAVAEDATVTLQTATDKQLTLNGTFGTETTSLIVQGGGRAILGEATTALASANIKENTVLTFAGATAISNGLTFGSGASIVTNGALTLSGTASYTGNTQTRENIPTTSNGYSTITTYANIISGSGSVNTDGVTSWLLNGKNGEYGNGAISYTETSKNYYIINNESQVIEGDVAKLNLTEDAIISNSTFTVTDFTDVVADKTLAFNNDSTVTVTGTGGVWIHNGSVVSLDASSKLIADGLTISGGTITKGDNGKDAAQIGSHVTTAFHSGVVLTGSSITVGGELLREYTVSGGTVNIASGTTTEVKATLSNKTAVVVAEGSTAKFTVDSDILSLSGDAVEAAANLTVAGAVELNSLTIDGGKTVTLGTAANHDHTLTLQNLTVNGDATVNADLVLGTQEQGADITLKGTLTMGCDVTIASGSTLTVDGDVTSSLVTLFKGVDNLTLGSDDHVAMGWYNASTVLSSLTYNAETTSPQTISGSDLNDYVIGYWNGTVTISEKSIPEPATATLSLLALAGLCARRKRK